MDAIPVIDLRLLTQAELNALAASSASSALDPRRADDIIVPKIDRSVFNESAGSRKQTYSRLRLAPPKAASSGPSAASTTPRRRGRPRSTARASAAPSALPDASSALDEQERKENEQIIQFLRQLLENNGRTENLTPPKLSLSPKSLPVTESNLNSSSAPNANGEASPLPENIAPALNEVSTASAPKKRGRKKKLDKEEFGFSFTDAEANDSELLNVNDVPVDLTRLGEKENLFREELIKRTEGLVTEEEFLDYLTVLEGRWGSRRKRRKVVDAGGFGDWLPKGWKLLLGLKRQGRSVWLHCRRFISPRGKQFKSCKEISSYLLSLVGAEAIIKTDSVKVDVNTPGSDDSPDGSAAGPVDQASAETETPSCSLSSSSKVENPSEVQLRSILECQKCNMTFPDKESHAQHLLSAHRRSTKRCRFGKSITDGVIVKDGIYECQFCHKVFTERHRYNGHVGVHAKIYSQSVQALSNNITIDSMLEPSTLVGPLTVSEINTGVENKRTDAANDVASITPIHEHVNRILETGTYEKAENSSSPISYTPDPSFELSRKSSNNQVDNCIGVNKMKVDDACNEQHRGWNIQFDDNDLNNTAYKAENTTNPKCCTNISRTPFNYVPEKSMVDGQQEVESKVDGMHNECVVSDSHTRFSPPHVTRGSAIGIPDNGDDSAIIWSEDLTTSTDMLDDKAPDFNIRTELSKPSHVMSSSVLADGKVINQILTVKETDSSMNVEAYEPSFDVPSSTLADVKVIQLTADAEKGNRNIEKAESSKLTREPPASAFVDTNLTDPQKKDILGNDREMTDAGLIEEYTEVECNATPSCISMNDDDGSHDKTGQKPGDVLHISSALCDVYVGVHSDPQGSTIHAAPLDETDRLVSLDANPHDLVNDSSKNAVQSNKDADVYIDPYPNVRDFRPCPESKMTQTTAVAETDSGHDYVDPQDLASKPPNNIVDSTNSKDVSLMPSNANCYLSETSTEKAVGSSSAVQSIVDTGILLNQSSGVRGLGLANVVSSCDTAASFNPTLNQSRGLPAEDNLNSDCHLARMLTTWQSSSDNDLFTNTCLEEIDNSLCERQFFLEHSLSSPHVGASSYQIPAADVDIMRATSHESLNIDAFDKQETHPRNEMGDISEKVERGPCGRLEGSSHANCLGGLPHENQNCRLKDQMLSILPSDVQISTTTEGSDSRLGGDFGHNHERYKDGIERNALENVSANTCLWMHSSNFLSMSMVSEQDAEKLYETNQKQNYTDFEGVKLESFNSSDSIVMPNQVSQLTPEVHINLTGNRELESVFESSMQSDWDMTTATLGGKPQLPAVCMWCRSKFSQQGVSHQTQESIGVICPSCKSKISMQLKF